MSAIRNTNVIILLSVLLLTITVLIISMNYFNTKEINTFTSQCYKNKGAVKLEIHNNLTGRYSLECK